MNLPPEIVERLRDFALIPDGASVKADRLTGGVSSDIWKVVAGDRVFCVKRAMAKLAVEEDWFAPVERNRYERLWYETVSTRVGDVAPKVLAYDDDAMFFVMDWLDPADHRLWKSELMAGRVDQEFATAVGRSLAAIHASTAGDGGIAQAFPTERLFEALRLDPYLRATGRRHPDLAAKLNGLADRTASTGVALVHGDVSPKNIMNRSGSHPVFLDAECAWYGDPAFDLAFCLNHLLLKCVAVPNAGAELLAAFEQFCDAYRTGIDWEPGSALEARAASLLPGLLLARVDGKSPVEYVNDAATRDRIRAVAIPLIKDPPATLDAVMGAWAEGTGLK